jgi:GNAT superfamily N-acetyltransferase
VSVSRAQLDKVIRLLGVDEVPEVAAFYIDIQADTVPTIHPLHEVIEYITSVRVANGSSYVLEQNDKILAWLDVADGWVHHLCVRRGETGKGFGKELLAYAKLKSPEGLQLWTFQVNDGARRFYKREGFQEVELTNGENCEEKQPDVRLVWMP